MQETIIIRSLTKAYGNLLVLDHLSFEIPCGKVTAVTAPSGTGKTTLLRILMGLEQPDEGTILGLSGKRISAVFQEDRLCENLTAPANIGLVVKKPQKEALIHQMEKIGLLDCEKKPVRELSGGMKRRISILRALSAEYDLLLLDEPFRGLDWDTKKRVAEEIKRQSAGKTVILVTHDRMEIEMMEAASEIVLKR